MTKRRKVIVHIATSADGYIARSDGDLEWLTSRPAPKGSRRHRHVPLELHSIERFEDGVVQLHYRVQKQP